jgi:predicted metalloprotease
MRWDPEHESPDLIDRRGERSGPGGGGLLFLVVRLLPWLIRTPFGWAILLALLGYAVFQGVTHRGLFSGTAEPQGGSNVTDPQTHFVAFVLDDVQSTWKQDFAARDLPPYRNAKLVLFTDATETGCGYGRAATGPFYCPEDERVYIDLGFYRELEQRLGARGDFAKAYVIAHEIGHHVQQQLGTSNKGNVPARGAAGGSVRLELQADCYAGVWAHSTGQRDLLEAGDIESAVNAAAAIGDDRLQRQETGTVSPDSFTHGTSAQRVRWFTRGYQTGKLESCDTFEANPPL